MAGEAALGECGRPLEQETGPVLFVYKLSAYADKRYKLIHKIKISAASKNTLHLEAVIDPANTSRDIYAAKAMLMASPRRGSRKTVGEILSASLKLSVLLCSP